MFERLAEEPDGFRREQERMRLILKIRATLNEYSESRIALASKPILIQSFELYLPERFCVLHVLIHRFIGEAILQDSQMRSFRPPTRQAHEAFCWKFNMSSDNEKNSVLLGDSWGLYTDRHDLIALARPAEEDRLTAALRNYLPFLFPGNIAREDGVNSCDENKIRRTVTATSVGLAFMLLYGAILTFYYVRSEKTVLGLAAVYTIAFALAVGLLTNAKRSEIIIAVAAYTAVIVLLISSPLGSLNSGSSLGNGTRCVCR